MGTGHFVSLVLVLTQLSVAILARDLSSAERSYQADKPTETEVYPPSPAEPWGMDGGLKDSDKGSMAEEKDKKWKEMAVWGKRESNPDKKWHEMAVWGKREKESDPEKKWHEMAVWGKRPFDSEMDKKWKEMAVWGKRSDGDDLDKRWKEMAVWGKRQNDLDLDKKWKEMAVWGKRGDDAELDKKWKEMAVWGKRSDDMDMDKKWKEMAVWGKRSGDMDMDKKWKEMAVWGKRSGDMDMDKKWKEMAVWGKRFISPEIVAKWKELRDQRSTGAQEETPVVESTGDFTQGPDFEKQAWGKYGAGAKLGKWDSMPVLDKEELHTQDGAVVRRKKSLDRDRWWRVKQRLEQMTRKRPSWSNTGFNAWGKRSDGMLAAGSPIRFHGYPGL